MEKIPLIITMENQTIYEGNLKASALNNGISLGFYNPGSNKVFDFKLQIPKDLKNNYALMQYKSKMDILSSFIDAETSAHTKPVKTGDYSKINIYLMSFLLSVSALLIFIIKKWGGKKMKLKKIKSKIYSTSILVFSFIMILPISISGNAANDSMLTDKSNYVKDDLTENSDTILKENINIQTEEEGITEEPVVISSDDSIDNVNTNLDLAVEGTTIDYTMETINKKFRNAPGGTVKINIAQRRDWFYHPNYPRTAIAAMALKVCGSDGDTPIMQERQRVAYCLEYQKSSPSVSVTQGSSYTTNKALVLCMLLGEIIIGEVV